MHNALRSLAWLEPVVELLRLGAFLLFIAFLSAYAAERGDEQRRRRSRLVIAYVVAVTTLVGLTQIDAWPFTNWALVHGLRSPEMHSWELEAVDASGRVWMVDKSVLQPMAAEEIAAPLGVAARLAIEDRREVARWLYSRAEEGRQRLRHGDCFPVNDCILGSLSAPYHFEASRRWRSARDVPPAPFQSVRLVFTSWDIRARAARGDSAVQRRVVTEFPER